MNKIKEYILILFIGFLLISLNTGWAEEQPEKPVKRQNSVKVSEIQRLLIVIGTIHKYYIEPVKNSKLFDDAIRGMLSGLDPHSSYLSEKDLKALQIAATGKFDGIGITIAPERDALKVITPLDGSPAEKAGIKSGDLIVRINDKLVKNIDTDQAIASMRGKRGTKVTLYIIRKDVPKLIKLKVTRNKIKVPSVKGKLFDKHYGYVRIAFFSQIAKQEAIKTIEDIKKQAKGQLNGLVVDLRNNPGGLLNSAVDIADIFLDAENIKENQLIVYTNPRTQEKRLNFKATKGELLPKIPIVVLINQGSASAAEIVAGALQDHKRAVILGGKSFGKGSVQSLIPVSKKSAVKLTTGLYYTPKGRSIQAQGIKPDVIIADLKIPKTETDSIVFDPIYEADLNKHIENHYIEKVEFEDKAIADLAHKDFQLYAALKLLKGLNAVHGAIKRP